MTGEAFAWRELDAIRVKGRTQALKIYELLALATELDASQQAAVAELRRRPRALARPRIRRSRRHASAARPKPTGRPRCFASAPGELAEKPPGEDWDPVRTLQEK